MCTPQREQIEAASLALAWYSARVKFPSAA